MQRQVVQLGLSAIATTVLASSAWAAATPWTPNTSGNVGAAPTTFNKWEAIEAPAESGASCGNGTPYRFFVNRTTNAANMAKTVIVFEGGDTMMIPFDAPRSVLNGRVREKRHG